MMKRRISLLLIMLTNILILAHAIVPHHHHNKMFEAIVNALDCDSKRCFNHEHATPHHHHAAWTVTDLSINRLGEPLTVVAVVFSEPVLQRYDAPETFIQRSSCRWYAGFTARAKDLRAPPQC